MFRLRFSNRFGPVPDFATGARTGVGVPVAGSRSYTPRVTFRTTPARIHLFSASWVRLVLFAVDRHGLPEAKLANGQAFPELRDIQRQELQPRDDAEP